METNLGQAGDTRMKETKDKTTHKLTSVSSRVLELTVQIHKCVSL